MENGSVRGIPGSLVTLFKKYMGQDMANKQLEGRIFNRGGTNYLVLAGNDWNSGTVRVKTVDAKRSVLDMPLQVVLRCVSGDQARR